MLINFVHIFSAILPHIIIGAADIPIVRLNPFGILGIKKDGRTISVYVAMFMPV